MRAAICAPIDRPATIEAVRLSNHLSACPRDTRPDASLAKRVSGNLVFWDQARGFDVIVNNADVFSEISPFWYHVTAGGQVVPFTNASGLSYEDPAILSFLRSRGILVIPTVANILDGVWDGSMVSGILAARMLGAHSRGELALIVLFPTLLTQLGSMGVPIALTYYVADVPARARATAHGVVRVFLVQAVVLTVADIAIMHALFGDASSVVRTAAYASAVVVPTNLAELYGLGLLQGLKAFRPFT